MLNNHSMKKQEELTNQAKNLYDNQQYEKAVETYKKIIELDYENANVYENLGDSYYELKQYENALEAYKKAIDLDPKSANVYGDLGVIYKELKEYDKAIDSYKKAIEFNPQHVFSYYGMGVVYRNLKKYNLAIESYEKAIKIDSSYIYPYNGLGNVYNDLKQYGKAIGFYEKAIEMNSNFVYSYNGLGTAYSRLKEYDKAINAHKRGIEIDSSRSANYYNIAIVLYKVGRYKESKEYYQRYVKLESHDEYYSKVALSKIEEIDKLLANAKLTELKEKINSVINKIQGLLLYKGESVTHYTGLTVTKALILEKSKFRLSEGAFLNDTSEGKELFEFLGFSITPKVLKGTEAIVFTQKPFIGSFVAENKHDDLTLWRMYGKENKEEAKGCATTINRDGFINKIRNEISKDVDSLITDNGFSFYRVAYQENAGFKFIIPGDKKSEDKLNNLMKRLKSLIHKFNRTKNKQDADMQNIAELLNGIAYLFKSAEYQYEYELRLVVDGAGFSKDFDENKNNDILPPRVYINLVDIRDLIKKLTIGPKVERADEWAAAFYYSLEKDGTPPEILISHLPYK